MRRSVCVAPGQGGHEACCANLPRRRPSVDCHRYTGNPSHRYHSYPVHEVCCHWRHLEDSPGPGLSPWRNPGILITTRHKCPHPIRSGGQTAFFSHPADADLGRSAAVCAVVRSTVRVAGGGAGTFRRHPNPFRLLPCLHVRTQVAIVGLSVFICFGSIGELVPD